MSDEKHIREFAYQLWESEGKPEGRDQEHWEKAVKLAKAKSQTPDAKPKKAPAKAKAPADAKGAAKPKAPAAPKAAAVPGEKPAPAKKPRAPKKPDAN
ncbi:DUF2934 domain-containing protein [Pseudomonas sp. S75]|uniref:DUF2934 domain-containing protein n=1 Tax=unclassified Pseudomonas TaxID=196821 RepID=UPI0019048CF2|nr:MULTISPECIES: DUF2934 domain-containing protein [unclassified Pseudomonas]MBJ9974016.1 DUF2934 domain-containing protein [Pseudomonas sp. S30]MBK0152054.1 DUF2934 domain-containing protein [Pseudomonas sp. S75]